MYEIEVIREFLGWCSIINIGLYIFSVSIIIFAIDILSQIHAKLFNLDKNLLPSLYFKWMAQYKLLIIVFNIVPYFALFVIK